VAADGEGWQAQCHEADSSWQLVEQGCSVVHGRPQIHHGLHTRQLPGNRLGDGCAVAAAKRLGGQHNVAGQAAGGNQCLQGDMSGQVVTCSAAAGLM